MSGQSALAKALVELLCQPRPVGFGLSDGECDLCLDGRPPALAGEYFWGVHGGPLTLTGTTSYIANPVLNVTLSARTKAVPFDKLGSGLYFADNGVLDRLEYFAAWCLSKQYDLMDRANELLQVGHDVPVNGFVHPTFKVQIQPPRVANPDHWQSEGTRNKTLNQAPPAGVIGVVMLSEFEREQYLEAAVQ